MRGVEINSASYLAESQADQRAAASIREASALRAQCSALGRANEELRANLAEFAANEAAYRRQIKDLKRKLAETAADASAAKAAFAAKRAPVPAPARRTVPRRAVQLSERLADALAAEQQLTGRASVRQAAGLAQMLRVELAAAAPAAPARAPDRPSSAGIALLDQLQDLAKRQQERIIQLAEELFVAQEVAKTATATAEAHKNALQDLAISGRIAPRQPNLGQDAAESLLTLMSPTTPAARPPPAPHSSQANNRPLCTPSARFDFIPAPIFP